MLSESLISEIQAGFAANEEKSSFRGNLPVLPSQDKVTQILGLLRSLLFPDFFPPNTACFWPLVQGEAAIIELTGSALEEQIYLALQNEVDTKESPSSRKQRAMDITSDFMRELPRLQALLTIDMEAIFDGDPAAKSYAEIIFSYPSFQAIIIHRLAHLLWLAQVPLLPRMMSEFAHQQTGIDIHPGAQIGRAFCIDHGTGIVIGETAQIGNHVKLYQGVTLGALSLAEGRGLADIKRHPTVEDYVTLYANSTVLGGKTVIGAHSIIGGGVFLTKSVAPHTKVLAESSDLILTEIQVDS